MQMKNNLERKPKIMNKRLGLFIVLAVILIVIAGTIGIKEVIEPASGGVAQRKVEEFGIEQEGQIYVIGEHLFTERNIKGYLSENMILEAAKTVDGITEGMTKEEILSKIIVYARDAEGNWINALTGENITTLGSDFKFNIKYINLSKIPEKVSSEEELIAALADNTISTVSLSSNITLNNVLEVNDGREITVELNGNTIDSTNVTNSSYGFKVNKGGTLIINGKGELIAANVANKANILNLGGTLEVNSVKMTGYYNIMVNENKSAENTATTTVNDSELIATGHSCVAAFDKSVVNINNNSKLEGFYAAVATNGNWKDVVITVDDSELSATCDVERSSCLYAM